MLHPLFAEDLWRDLFNFRKDFDEIFNRLMITRPMLTEPKLQMVGFVPPVEGWIDRETKKFYLRIALPGIEPHEVNVQLQGNLLTIKGERKLTQTKKEVEPFYREIGYGAFERTLTLPEGVDVEKLVAEFNHGVLEISAPVVAAALPRRIEVKSLVKKAA
jgi:HSP20 family protein